MDTTDKEDFESNNIFVKPGSSQSTEIFSSSIKAISSKDIFKGTLI
jgi:hypothetical protein